MQPGALDVNNVEMCLSKHSTSCSKTKQQIKQVTEHKTDLEMEKHLIKNLQQGKN